MEKNNSSKGVAKASFKFFQYVVMIVILIVCATLAFRFGSAVFSNSSVEEPPGTDKTITVVKGTTIGDLGEMLEEYNIINSATVFKVQAVIYGVDEVKPGTYNFNNSKGGEELFKIISAGPEEAKPDTEEVTEIE